MNLDFSIIPDSPIMDDACYYCGTPIRAKHIRITFESKKKILLHIDMCWENFVSGVNAIESKLNVGSMN